MFRTPLLPLFTAAVLGFSALALAGPSAADGMAAIEPGGELRARDSFQTFARSWMARLERNAIAPASSASGRAAGPHTYVSYADDFEIELRPTGYPRAPFVGLLRYTEQQVSCQTPNRACGVTAATPVTEIFRYQNGRWVY